MLFLAYFLLFGLNNRLRQGARAPLTLARAFFLYFLTFFVKKDLTESAEFRIFAM